MRKVLRSVMLAVLSIVASVSFAQDPIVFDFSNAETYGYENPESGKFTQVENASTLSSDKIVITANFESGNGLRFFCNNTDQVSLRAYIGAKFTVATKDGSYIKNIEFAGSNIATNYLTAPGYDGKTWNGGNASVEFTCVKSTVIIDKITVTLLPEGENPEPAVDLTNTLETAYTVTEANAFITEGKGLETPVYVKGRISEIKDLSLSYGNATYTITDDAAVIDVFRGLSLKGEKFTKEDEIKVGDEVVVYGKLVNFNGTYEIAQNNQIVSLNGKTEPDPEELEPVVTVGHGTEEDPYTIADAIALHAGKQTPEEKVWVKGFIGGNVNTGDGSLLVPASAEEASESNLALIDGGLCMPIQLISGNKVREALNLKKNFELIGTECAIYGNIETYCKVAGLKNTTNYQLFNAPSGDELPEGCTPGSIQDFTAEWNIGADGANNVTMSFVTPDFMINPMWEREPMTANITKIVISRSITNMAEYEEIHTIEKPAKGESITWTDTNVPFGSYDYMITVYVGETADWGSSNPVIVGQVPADIEFGMFSATISEKNDYTVILQVTLPTTNSMGEPLTMPITKVEFGELGPMSFEPEVIYTETDSEILLPGETLMYIIENATDGLHSYSVQVYTEAGSCWPANADIFVGKDQPGMVMDLTAEETTEGVLVKWEAPMEGLNGGSMGNIDDITYTVKRGTSEYDENAVVIAEDIKDLSVLDKVNFTEETKFVYIVTAKSPYGEGYPCVSNELVMGPASVPPFYENFDVVGEYGYTSPEHASWSKGDYSDWYNGWQFGQYAVVDGNDIMPYNGTGLLYAYYDAWMNHDCWEEFVSGNIDFSNATAPTMTFWLYDIAKGGSDVTLTVKTIKDGEDGPVVTDAAVIAMGNAEKDGWRQITVDLSAVAFAPKAKVCFHSESVGTNSFAVLIDAIAITATPEDETGINGIASAQDAKRSASFNLMGQRVQKNAKGIIIVDGKKILNK